MCVHHLPDERKHCLFAEIFDHLVPGGWYLNYDPVSTAARGTTSPATPSSMIRKNEVTPRRTPSPRRSAGTTDSPGPVAAGRAGQTA
jgi:hypothetical protein